IGTEDPTLEPRGMVVRRLGFEGMSERRTQRLPGIRVPDPGARGRSDRQDETTCGIVSDVRDLTTVPQGLAGRSSAARIPDSDQPLAAAGDHPTAIRAEGHGPNLAAMLERFPDGLPPRKIPQAGRSIVASAQEGATVRAELEDADPISMPENRADALAL